MDRLSFSSFGVARFMMAIAVFFCHVFYHFNYLGFLFCGVFFFMSGYGMEISNRRMNSLVRLVPYILVFLWFSVVYWLLFGVFPYPSSWFLVVYFVIMVFYRFIRNVYGLLAAFFALAWFFAFFGFEFGWSASFGAFLFGVFFARSPGKFTLGNCFLFLPLLFGLFNHLEIAFWGVLPLFTWIVLSVSSLKVFRSLAFLGRYTFYFYCVHCLFLGLFESTWTLGGSPALVGSIAAFCASVLVSMFFEDYLFNYQKMR